MWASALVSPLGYEPASLRERQLASVLMQSSACAARLQGLLHVSESALQYRLGESDGRLGGARGDGSV